KLNFHLHHGLNSRQVNLHPFTVWLKMDRGNRKLVMLLEVRTGHRIFRGAISLSPTIVPDFNGIVLWVFGSRFIESARKTDLHSLWRNVKAGGHMDWASSETNSLESSVSQASRLPALQTTHVKLTVDRMKARAHDA